MRSELGATKCLLAFWYIHITCATTLSDAMNVSLLSMMPFVHEEQSFPFQEILPALLLFLLSACADLLTF